MGAFSALATRQRLSIFPLAGAVLFPEMHMPLHIFEPRYRAMIADALERDRMIGLIQPNPQAAASAHGPALFAMGCLGRLREVEALDDGRYNVVLEGLARFRLVRELDAVTPFRQIEADVENDLSTEALVPASRTALEQAAQDYAMGLGYSIDWAAVRRLDDTSFVNGVAQVAPFDPAVKQALLEAHTLRERAELVVQFIRFYARRDRDDDMATLQ